MARAPPTVSPSTGPSQEVLTAAEIAILGRGTNDDVALAFALDNLGRYLFNYETKKWLEWNGHRWEVRPDEYMRAEMREFCQRKAGHESKQPRQASF